MELLAKLLGKKKVCHGVVSVCFLPQGLSVAIAKYTLENKLALEFSDFFAITDKNEQANTLSRLANEYGLKQFHCYLLLAPADYRHLTIETPPVTSDEMREALRWKIADLVDFSVEEACIDFYHLPEAKHSSSNSMLAAIASSTAVLKPKINRCGLAGLNIEVIDIQETALRNLATLLPENNRGVAILHLLPKHGSIIIQKKGSIYLSRKLDFGFTDLGLESQTLSQPINDLALDIQRSLDYVESYYGIPPISTLAVIPVPSHTEIILNHLNENLSANARIMDISTILEGDTILTDKTQAYCATVIGATLRHEVSDT
ncbi:MAG: pilus assembly protein PilM [Methyloprofundus sp.]|nr:pilus assembly protein PilM [Methyloprofundus sp.]MDT8426860.1 pilus assembly protein PilM [Methyloprofundus sp.]